MKLLAIKLFLFLIVFAAFAVAHPVAAYAPNVTGKIIQNTGAPIPGVWVEWSSQETGDDDNQENKGTSVRYSGTGEDGGFKFKSWDSEGTVEINNIQQSIVGRREHEEKINLDYDEGNGREARRSSTPNYDIFNCHNEVNSFALKLPESLQDVKVKARWRRDSNNTAWSPWSDNKISLPKEIFNNSHDYEIQFQIELPKKASIRDLDNDIEPEAISGLKSNVSKVPACVQVDLCTDDSKGLCSDTYKAAEGKHRVVLSRVGDTGIGEARRKLTSNNGPLWLVECIQEGTPAAPAYTCTTGNSTLDTKVFGADNASTLAGKYGYASKIFYTDGTPTTPEITDSNKQDAYEWETTMNPEIAKQRKVASVFLAMYEDEGTAPPQSGQQNSQKQATLSNSEGCRLVIDPYGKVFDSYTLEPLSGSTVTLLKQRSGNTFTKVQQNEVVGTLVNPQVTLNGGSYRFIVPNGTYGLQVNRPGYRFPATDSNKDAANFYSNIYSGGEITVKDQPVRADIALEPQSKEQSIAYAENNPITITNYFQTINKEKGIQTIDGYVSHPKAVIEIFGQKGQARTRKLASNEADKDGHFTVAVQLSQLQEDEYVGEIEATKKKVNGIAASPKTAVLAIAPMLDSLAGFATSRNGSVIANSQVEVRLLTSGTTVATVQADDKGFFTIPAEEMPSMPYSLAFKNGPTEEVLDTLTYVANNEKLSGTNNVYASAGSNVLGESTESIPPEFRSTTRPTGGLMVVAVILIVFVFTVTALLSIYISHEAQQKKRRHR